MENSSSNSIEMQIDNFLEQFKRSASKAMESDWSPTATQSNTNLIRSKSRASCLDIMELTSGIKINIVQFSIFIFFLVNQTKNNDCNLCYNHMYIM